MNIHVHDELQWHNHIPLLLVNLNWGKIEYRKNIIIVDIFSIKNSKGLNIYFLYKNLINFHFHFWYVLFDHLFGIYIIYINITYIDI